MLADCQTAEDVRRLAARQAGWRRQMFQQKPEPAVVEVVEQPKPAPRPQLKPKPSVAVRLLPFTQTERIQLAVCARFNIGLLDLRGERRMAHLVRPRHVAIWLVHRMTQHSLPQIGRRFGRRDHTTILNAVRSIDAKRAVDPELDRLLNELESELTA